jgi:NAD(P)H-dependent FMN reductase
MKHNLKIIIGSTRTARKGPIVAKWIFEVAKQHADFETELIDLAEINLPFLDEPNHPRLQQYTHQHTKDWSAKIAPADAFIFVTPEYNYGYPAALKNAIDFLYKEWNYKPVAFVSYGGVAAGTRSMQALKLVISSLKMVALLEAINLPFFTNYIDANGNFTANESLNKTANAMLDELSRWAENLKAMRGTQTHQ